MDFYSKHFVPFPMLKTKDLTLRKIRISDTADLYDYCKRPESSRYSNWSPHESQKSTREFVYWLQTRYIKRQCYTFCIEYKGRAIGTASYMNFDEYYGAVEIGYGLNSDYWHKGLGRQAVWALTGFAFDKLGVQRVYAKVMPENIASSSLLLSFGYQYEGTARKSEYIKGKYIDVATYSMLKDEYILKKESQNGIKTDSKLCC